MAAYLTFLLDVSNETRLLESTLRFVPDPARMPSGPNIWKVVCDAKSHVYVRAIDDGKLVLLATAVWSGRLTDKSEKSEISDKQWERLQLALEAASAKRKMDPAPYDDSLVERADGGPLLPLRSFLVDVNAGIVDGTMRDSIDDTLVPASETVWKVTCLANGEVALHTIENGMNVLLATASWDGNALTQKRIATNQVSASQWTLVTTALRDAALVKAAPPHAPDDESNNVIALDLDIDGDGDGDLNVTCDAFGLVTVRADGKTLATARWDGARLDGKRIEAGQVSAMQWNDIAVELHAAKVASVMRALDTEGDYLTFLLGMTIEAPVSPVLVGASNLASPLAPNTWKVRMDRSGTIAVASLVDGNLAIVATAQWAAGKLAGKHVKRGPISKEQWARLRTAIPIATTLFEATRAAAIDATRPPFVPTPYVTFLLSLADGDADRIASGSLHFIPNRDVPRDAFVWKITSDAKGTVRIYSLGMTLVGNATWNGTLIERKQVELLPTEYQWLLVEQALAIAFERRAGDPTPIDWSLVEPVAPEQMPEPPVFEPAPVSLPGGAYRAFLFDIRGGEIVDGSVRSAPDPALVPERVFVWKVVLDRSTVVVFDRDGDRLATGTWDNALVETAQSGSVPNDAQWKMVRKALNRVCEIRDADGRTTEDAYTPRTARSVVSNAEVNRAKIAKASRRFAALVMVGSAALVLGVALLMRRADRPTSKPTERVSTTVPAPPPAPPPPPPPPRKPLTQEEQVAASLDLTSATSVAGAKPALLANYRVRWSEVDVASQTTIEQVEKEPVEETGKRLCVEGELEHITRADLAGHRHYTAALTTAQGDRVEVVVSGSAGALVKRQHARVCGVVLGATHGATTVYGMFDLPENRNPTVEKPD